MPARKRLPSYLFDVMVPLPVYLSNEAMLAGKVPYQWFYIIEWWLYFLKCLISNRACPKGFNVKDYLANKCMTLCLRHFHRFDTKSNQQEWNYDAGLKESDGHLPLFYKSDKTLRARKYDDLEANELDPADIYIQKNCEEVLPFLEYVHFSFGFFILHFV